MPTQADYGIKTTVKLDFEAAIERVAEELKARGFGILTQIDMQGTLKQKIGADIHKYMILGACAPDLAHRALQAEPDIGLLLPCNVVVYQDDDTSETTVAALDPIFLAGTSDNADLQTIARTARDKLNDMIETLRAL